MRRITIICLLALMAIPHAFAVKNGDLAPDFELSNQDGKKVKLSDLKGKIVVLEWLNHGCPFVKKHYDPKFKNMQNLQKRYTANSNLVWYSIISSAPGKQGHSTPKEALKEKQDKDSNATAVLLDVDGKVGRLYDAKTTPHMFIIDGSGKLVYQGAIDDKPTSSIEDIPAAKNYVSAALDVLLDPKAKDKKIEVGSTSPYGCSVKY